MRFYTDEEAMIWMIWWFDSWLHTVFILVAYYLASGQRNLALALMCFCKDEEVVIWRVWWFHTQCHVLFIAVSY